jgi:cysteinyl-tRNA synthetase
VNGVLVVDEPPKRIPVEESPKTIAVDGHATLNPTFSGTATVSDSEESRWINERLAARKEARARRDFRTSDAIRDELRARGFEIKDTPEGPQVTRIG